MAGRRIGARCIGVARQRIQHGLLVAQHGARVRNLALAQHAQIGGQLVFHVSHGVDAARATVVPDLAQAGVERALGVQPRNRN